MLLLKKHGAARIAKAIAEGGTHINLFVGRKINPAYQNPDMPDELNIRTRIVVDLKDVLIKAGKTVNIKYY